jgi:hypothetical protein
MTGKPLSKEEVNAALVLALSGALVALVANGPGPVSLGRIVSGALSNPVPGGGATGNRRSSSVPAPLRQQQQVAA